MLKCVYLKLMVRLFDVARIEEFSITERHFSADADIVMNKVFKRAVIKVEGGDENALRRLEKVEILRFLITTDVDDDDDDDKILVRCDQPGRNFAFDVLQEGLTRKRAKVKRCISKYWSMAHISVTSNSIERLFSRAKIVMTDLRELTTLTTLKCLCFCVITERCGIAIV